MNWIKPEFEDNRYGFEITMYVYVKSNTAVPLEASHLELKTRHRIFNAILPLALLLGSPGFTEAAPDPNKNCPKETQINRGNAKDLSVKWQFNTAPVQPLTVPNLGSVPAAPAVEGNYIYFADLAGYVYKNDRNTGQNIWKKHMYNDLSIPGYTMSFSRNTPLIVGNLLVLGNNYMLTDPLCSVYAAQNGVPPPAPVAGLCHNGDGAIVIALNKSDGTVAWRTKVSTHPSAKITGSLSAYQGKIFTGISSWEEDWARAYPEININNDGSYTFDLSKPYNCCSVQGGVIALNATDGSVVWETKVSIGLDAEGELSPALHDLLTKNDDGTPGKGFFGVSPYGHNPTIDSARNQVVVATSQTETAPQAAEQCELYRRNQTGIRPDLYGPVGSVANPDQSARFTAAGVTCATLNDKLKTYGNAVIALDMNTGKINWSFFARPYDAWNHACAAPDFHGFTGAALPFVFPVPVSNAANCFQDPIGPDYGFGNNPLLLKGINVGGGKQDLLVAGNKDGRLFAINPQTGAAVWEKSIEPGGIYGGVQFGMDTDGKNIYTGTSNAINVSRDRHQDFVSARDFLAADGLDVLVRGPGLHEKPGSPTDLHDIPGPGVASLPFPTPFYIYGPASGYPATPGVFFQGPPSGPLESYEVVNMPDDVTADGVNVWTENGKTLTIAGMVHSIDAATGNINWQRPAIDAISGQITASYVFSKVTYADGIVYAGYSDGQGTLVALNSANGRKLFEYHATMSLVPDPNNPNQMTSIPSGGSEMGPTVVDGTVYWGQGSATACLFPRSSATGALTFPSCGNGVVAFEVYKQCAKK